MTALETHFVIEENRQIPIPLTYVVEGVIHDLGPEIGFLREADDLFIDHMGMLYVADRGNDRVIKLDPEGAALRVFRGPEGDGLKGPRGIYVDGDGDLFIADTGNERILHMAPDGAFVEEFGDPESELLGETFNFDPMKVYINSTGIIHVIKSQAFLTMDADNDFRGLVGASYVGFDLAAWIVRVFATDEQKDRLAKRQPPPYSNFVIGSDGMIYATVVTEAENQIRKINSVGANIFVEQFFGEMVRRDDGPPELPHFVDIAVDDIGIISALEQRSGRVFQYDQEGNLLTVFGGIGNRKGQFSLPTSIVVDPRGRLYVLDGYLNSITVFAPTRFISTVHRAVDLYGRGDYAGALEIWSEVLRICANYALAHKGMGKALLKAEMWRGSMTEYQKADDRSGYSQAFAEYRHEIFRKQFLLVVLAVMVLVFVLVRLAVLLKRRAAKAVTRLSYVWKA